MDFRASESRGLRFWALTLDGYQPGSNVEME